MILSILNAILVIGENGGHFEFMQIRSDEMIHWWNKCYQFGYFDTHFGFRKDTILDVKHFNNLPWIKLLLF